MTDHSPERLAVIVRTYAHPHRADDFADLAPWEESLRKRAYGFLLEGRIADLERSLERDPPERRASPARLLVAGAVLLVDGYLTGAEDALERAESDLREAQRLWEIRRGQYEISQRLAAVHVNLAFLARSRRSTGCAQEELRAAQRLAPGMTAVWIHKLCLASEHLEDGNEDPVEAVFEEMETAHPCWMLDGVLRDAVEADAELLPLRETRTWRARRRLMPPPSAVDTTRLRSAKVEV